MLRSMNSLTEDVQSLKSSMDELLKKADQGDDSD